MVRCKGFCPTLPRLSPRFARCRVGKTVHRTVFYASLFESLVSIIFFESLTKKKRVTLSCNLIFLWRAVRDFVRRSRVYRLASLVAASAKQSTGLFSMPPCSNPLSVLSFLKVSQKRKGLHFRVTSFSYGAL